MPRRVVNCDNYVFDALVFDKYQSGGTNIVERRRKLDIVYKAMKNELTPRQFQILKEYYVHGRKMKDIAEELSVHPSTITRQIRRAKAKIMHIANYY